MTKVRLALVCVVLCVAVASSALAGDQNKKSTYKPPSPCERALLDLVGRDATIVTRSLQGLYFTLSRALELAKIAVGQTQAVQSSQLKDSDQQIANFYVALKEVDIAQKILYGEMAVIDNKVQARLASDKERESIYGLINIAIGARVFIEMFEKNRVITAEQIIAAAPAILSSIKARADIITEDYAGLGVLASNKKTQELLNDMYHLLKQADTMTYIDLKIELEDMRGDTEMRVDEASVGSTERLYLSNLSDRLEYIESIMLVRRADPDTRTRAAALEAVRAVVLAKPGEVISRAEMREVFAAKFTNALMNSNITNKSVLHLLNSLYEVAVISSPGQNIAEVINNWFHYDATTLVIYGKAVVRAPGDNSGRAEDENIVLLYAVPTLMSRDDAATPEDGVRLYRRGVDVVLEGNVYRIDAIYKIDKVIHLALRGMRAHLLLTYEDLPRLMPRLDVQPEAFIGGPSRRNYN